MVDADLTGGNDLKPAIERLFANPAAACIHADYAKRCSTPPRSIGRKRVASDIAVGSVVT